MELQLNPQKTALVVIDLQKGITQLPVKPLDAATVIQNAAKLADAFRQAGGFVVLVNVDSHDGKDMLKPITDNPAPQAGERPKDWAEIVPEMGRQASDHLVTKRNWGAFYGTDLDLQLRRRGIDTIVLCGIATGIGVDTTAREAFQHGYNQVFATDAMSAISQEEHDYTHKFIFPRIGRSRTTEEIVAALR